MVNSRAKGVRGEHQVRDLFRVVGIEAKRGQQHAGGAESPDVVTEIPWLHIESKLCRAPALHKYLEQSERDAGLDKMATVFWRPNGKKWLAVMDGATFAAFIAQAHRKGIGL